MAFQVTLAAVQEWLDDDMSLQTLKNQFTVQEIFDRIEDKDRIQTDEQLFEALMDVMYATRPQGYARAASPMISSPMTRGSSTRMGNTDARRGSRTWRRSRTMPSTMASATRSTDRS